MSKTTDHPAQLRAIGFLVKEMCELPTSSELTGHHVVIVNAANPAMLPMLATRLRAKPHFGRRLLLALVPTSSSDHAKRDGLACGFDRVLPQSITGRALAAAIIERLRAVPEFRCLLGPLTRRVKAA
ncbi:MAG: hypothetical protein ACRD1V_01895 [Vicinamibacterales bacterium]